MSAEMYSTAPVAAGGIVVLGVSALTHTSAATASWFPGGLIAGFAVGFGIILLGFGFTWGIAPDILIGMVVVPAVILLLIAAGIFAFGPVWWGAPIVLTFLVAITAAGIYKKRGLRCEGGPRSE